MKLLCFLFLFFSLNACQYHAPKDRYTIPNKYTKIDDIEEYQSLLHACKIIKSQMIVIADHRMSIQDAIETSITLYLLNVKSDVAKELLKELKANGFNL